MKKHISIFLFLISTLMISSCASRIPSEKTAQKVIEKHFKKYGKTYPDSVFGKSTISKVTLLANEESQKHVAQTKARLELSDGSQMTIMMGMLYKAPLGWRAQGWEKLSE